MEPLEERRLETILDALAGELAGLRVDLRKNEQEIEGHLKVCDPAQAIATSFWLKVVGTLFAILWTILFALAGFQWSVVSANQATLAERGERITRLEGTSTALSARVDTLAVNLLDEARTMQSMNERIWALTLQIEKQNRGK